MNVRIPLPDGASLAGRVTLPDGEGPFPTLVTFYPYRKDDFIGAGETYTSAYFARAGYASVLVDNRGYGSSTGRTYQAWDPRELDDGAEALAWIREQPWCDGSLGLVGSSYGGHMAFGVASRNPSGLKALASVYGAADIYHDFVFPGGAANALGASAWAALMVALELAPPSLQDPEGDWLTAWRERLDRLTEGDISTLAWLDHPGYDEYWQQRRIPIEQIAAPTFFLSGWRDLLCQGMLHAYERSSAPKRLLVGPWSHAAPDTVTDAPYDWLLELRLWWDRWLKGEETEARPDVVYWLQGAGTWHRADTWPPPGEQQVTQPERAEYHCASDVGADAGLWYPMGALQVDAFEQARDDARSLCTTSEPLEADLAIAGAPTARVQLEVPEGEAVYLAVKVCDVAPDGSSTLVTSGWQRIEPGAAREVTADVELYPTAYRIPVGHSVRWTIAGSDFPRIWPSPTEPDIVVLASTEFRLPVAAELHAFDAPLPEAAPDRGGPILEAEPVCHFVRDEAKQSFSVTAGLRMKIALDQGSTFTLANSLTASLRRGRAQSAKVETTAEVVVEFPTGEIVRVETAGLLGIGRRHISGRLTSGEHTLFEQQWSALAGA